MKINTDQVDTVDTVSDDVAAALNAEDTAFALATAQAQIAYLSRRVGELVSEVTALRSADANG